MSHITRLHTDQILHIFSFLNPCDLGRLASVCRQGYLLHANELVWKPLLEEVVPLKDRCEKLPSKVLFLRSLKQFQPRASEIIKTIPDNDKLRSIFNDPAFSLEKLEKMNCYDRSHYIRKHVGKDCTLMLRELIDQVQILALNKLCALHDLQDNEKGILLGRSASLLYSLIEDPIGPFDAASLMRFLEPIAKSPVPVLNWVMLDIHAKICSTHSRFPELLAEPGFVGVRFS